MAWNSCIPSVLRKTGDSGAADSGFQHAVQNAYRKRKEAFLVLNAQRLPVGGEYHHHHQLCFVWHIRADHSGGFMCDSQQTSGARDEHADDVPAADHAAGVAAKAHAHGQRLFAVGMGFPRDQFYKCEAF